MYQPYRPAEVIRTLMGLPQGVVGAKKGAAAATLVYWARDPGWLVYDAELRALAQRWVGFAYHPVVRDGAGWTGARAASTTRPRITSPLR